MTWDLDAFHDLVDTVSRSGSVFSTCRFNMILFLQPVEAADKEAAGPQATQLLTSVIISHRIL